MDGHHLGERKGPEAQNPAYRPAHRHPTAMDDLDLDHDDFFASLYDDGEEVPPRPRTGRRIVAAVLLIALLALVIEPTTRVLRQSSPSDRSPSDVAGATADAGLSGFPGRTVSDGDWSLQVGSAVLIGATGPNCGGAITTLGDRRYVTSARHCIDELLDPGVATEVSRGDGEDVREVTDAVTRAVEVFDPVSHRRIALLDRIVVGTGAMDLLVATTSSEGADYAARPARRIDRSPAMGDEVATFASSGADGFGPRRLTGVYLGLFPFTGSDGVDHVVELTAYRQPSSSRLIGRGHSGHSPTGAGGSALGPVLYSLNSETPPAQRVEDLRAMSMATGVDLAAEGFVGIDETLYLTPEDYLRLEQLLR